MNAPQVGSLIGRHVGRYRVSRHLASGGMGSVYEVVQDNIGHRAAMKVLSSNLSTDPKHRKYVERFLDEARAVNLINNPGVLQIFDFAEMEDHTVYILMEYIEGKALSDYLSKFREGSEKRIPVLQNLQIVRQIAAVMAVAHEKGVLHRDIKPSNIMLLPDPTVPGGQRVKVIDFGLAKFLDTPERRTTAGMAVGTAQYMAPEQCLGEENLDGKVDVYALGAMLYELMSGEPPFQGEIGVLMRKHVNETPRPLREVSGNVPESVIRLTHRMIEKRKEARPTMAEVAAEIGKLEASGELKSLTVEPLLGDGVDVHAPTTPAQSIGTQLDKTAEKKADRPVDKTGQLASPRHPLRPPKPGWIAGLLGGGIFLGVLLGLLAGGRGKEKAPQCAPCPPPCEQPAATAKPAQDDKAATEAATVAKPEKVATPVLDPKASKGKKGKGAKKSK